jgi:hypothetical protein
MNVAAWIFPPILNSLKRGGKTSSNSTDGHCHKFMAFLNQASGLMVILSLVLAQHQHNKSFTTL